ncbi:hypothetical protein HYY75_01905, partial [bacterium]|nr:hypothetical protein [bacterium]
MKCSQTNRSNSLMILFSFGLILFSAVNCAHAEEPDSFSIPSEDSASPTENKEAGSAEEANPAEAPGANPAEAPGANPAEAPGAEPAEEPSAQINPSMTETEQVDSLAQTCVFKPVNEKKDPFKPLV